MHHAFESFHIVTLASWLKIQPYNHGNLRRPECFQTHTFCTCPGKADWCFLSDDTHDQQGKGFLLLCLFFPLDRTATDVLAKPCELKACSWKSRLPCKQLPYRNHAWNLAAVENGWRMVLLSHELSRATDSYREPQITTVEQYGTWFPQLNLPGTEVSRGPRLCGRLGPWGLWHRGQSGLREVRWLVRCLRHSCSGSRNGDVFDDA